MDIREDVYIWVNDISESKAGVILDGFAFDGDFGFGGDDVREFQGELALYSEEGKNVIDSNLSTIHVEKKGTVWLLTAKELPAVPFLLSSNLSLVGPVKKSIRLKPSKYAEESFAKDGDSQYPIESEGVIGLLNHCKASDYLIMLAEDESFLNKPSYKLLFCEWELDAGETEPLSL